MKNLKPIFIENSKLPYWLSKVAPIDVWAFSAGPFVVCPSVDFVWFILCYWSFHKGKLEGSVLRKPI